MMCATYSQYDDDDANNKQESSKQFCGLCALGIALLYYHYVYTHI